MHRQETWACGPTSCLDTRSMPRGPPFKRAPPPKATTTVELPSYPMVYQCPPWHPEKMCFSVVQLLQSLATLDGTKKWAPCIINLPPEWVIQLLQSLATLDGTKKWVPQKAHPADVPSGG